MNEKIYQMALGLTSGVGSVLTRQLISYCGSAEAVFRSPRGKLMRIPGIGPKTADSLLNTPNLADAEAEYALAEKLGIRVLFYTDEAYPNRLKTVDDAPPLLYVRGNANLNPEKVVAIVGTRSATAYGKSVTEEIVAELTRFSSVSVISGLAYGIDIMAHKSALKHALPTVGVLGSGVDVVYPASHASTVEHMLASGGVLSEYRLGTKPDAPHFPARNRIIAGMTDALIVVEAAFTGGALITAEIANSYNKDVFAVPGNLKSTHSEGCNHLIKTHKASIFTSVNDLEYLMNWQENAVKAAPEIPLPYIGQTPDEQRVITLLHTHREMLMDELSWQSQIPVSQMASLLLTLELQGVVKALPGKKFALSR